MDGVQRGIVANTVDANYIKAREGLLDALAGLGPLRAAAVLVGAQAVYEHVQDQVGDFAVPPFTLDADLALIPELLVEDPKIIDAMASAGYTVSDQPGIYRRNDGVQVDLLVPESVSGSGHRGARLGVHGNRAARRVRGIEGALVSRRPMTISALAYEDERMYEISVAGPAPLLVAKIHKLAERIDANDIQRVSNKDAFDIFRLLRAVDTDDLTAEFRLLEGHSISATVAAEAMTRFCELFGVPTGAGTVLVAEHVVGIENRDVIVASSVALSQDLIGRLR